MPRTLRLALKLTPTLLLCREATTMRSSSSRTIPVIQRTIPVFHAHSHREMNTIKMKKTAASAGPQGVVECGHSEQRLLRAGVGPMPIVETEVEKPAAQGAAMEITVSRQDLVKELTATQSVVERKTTIPILSNFLIEAEGDRLNITATDLDQAIRTSAAVKVKKPGACTIPARKLYDYIKLLPDGDISIKLLENHWVQIRSGRSNTKMVGMARANYPAGSRVSHGRGHQHSAGRAARR